MPFVSEDIINQILSQADIVDIVSDVVTLSQVGKNYKGLCPFHPEKTPSFYVNQEKQVFHCFGCGKSGNIFTFIKEQQGLSFSEALQSLANRYGITISYKNDTSGKNIYSERDKIIAVNRGAGQYFHNKLFLNQKALYYMEKRGIKKDTLRDFQLGYSGASWNELYFNLKKNYSTDILLKAGLILNGKNNGSFYDRFRERIIFPIFNLYGEIIAFGGRCISKTTDIAKYINSPETVVYKKGQNLYGLYHSHNDIRKKGSAILVEGYLDFLSVYQTGFTNVVATLGTALTISQVRLLKRYTDQVYLLFDSDSAGQKATRKGIELFLGAGIKIKIVLLPKGDDPDSFIQEKGHDAFGNALKKAKNFLEFLLSPVIDQTKDKIQRTREIIPILAKTTDPILRDTYIRYLAEHSGIAEDSILEAIGMTRNKMYSEKPHMNETFNFNTNNCLEEKAQRMLLYVALSHQAPCPQILKNITLADFSTDPLKSLASIIFNSWEKGEGVKIETLLNQTQNDDIKELITNMLLSNQDELGNKEKIISDCIKVIKNKKIQRNTQNIKEKMRSTEIEEEELNRLLVEYHKLKIQTININNIQ